MYLFAKIFEVNDEQLLVRKYDDNQIVYETIEFTFTDSYLTTNKRNEIFASFDQDAAVKMYEEMTQNK